MSLTYEPFDTITVSKVNEKLGGGIEKLNQEFNNYLPLSGGTVNGDLILGYDPNYAMPVKLKMGLSEESGFEISSANNVLTIADKDKKSVLNLTPSSINYFNGDIKVSNGEQIEIETQDQDILINSGNIYFHYDRIINGIDDGVKDNDAVNLRQLKELRVMKRCQITIDGTSFFSNPIIEKKLYVNEVYGAYTVSDEEGNDIPQDSIENFYIASVPAIDDNAYTPPFVNVGIPGERIVITWLSLYQLNNVNNWTIDGYYF